MKCTAAATDTCSGAFTSPTHHLTQPIQPVASSISDFSTFAIDRGNQYSFVIVKRKPLAKNPSISTTTMDGLGFAQFRRNSKGGRAGYCARFYVRIYFSLAAFLKLPPGLYFGSWGLYYRSSYMRATPTFLRT